MTIPEKGSKFLRRGRVSENKEDYFITINSFERKNIFNSPEAKKIILESINWLEQKSFWNISAYVIMPDHIHILISIEGNKELNELMYSLKSYVTNRFHKFNIAKGKVWQSQYYDHQIRNEEDYWECIDYILWNPVKKGLSDGIGKYKWAWCKHEIYS